MDNRLTKILIEPLDSGFLVVATRGGDTTNGGNNNRHAMGNLEQLVAYLHAELQPREHFDMQIQIKALEPAQNAAGESPNPIYSRETEAEQKPATMGNVAEKMRELQKQADDLKAKNMISAPLRGGQVPSVKPQVEDIGEAARKARIAELTPLQESVYDYLCLKQVIAGDGKPFRVSQAEIYQNTKAAQSSVGPAVNALKAKGLIGVSSAGQGSTITYLVPGAVDDE